MIIILIGAPGSGKGTQAKVLGAKYGLTHLSTGDIFRSEMAAETELGKKASEFVKSGKLVPDDLVTEMVASKLDASGRYLLDGFPRNLAQAKALDGLLAERKTSVTLVAYLHLSSDEALRRITSRRVCASCGEVFNTDSRPPKAEGRCDACQGELVQREDDNEATTRKRLMVYEDLTSPLISYYKAEQLLQEVDAAAAPDEVTQALSAAVDRAAAAA